MAPREAVADPEGQLDKDALDNQDLGSVDEGDHFDELRAFKQFFQKENIALHANCTMEKVIRAKGLLKGTALCGKNIFQKQKVEKVIRCLKEELSARGSFVEMRHLDNA